MGNQWDIASWKQDKYVKKHIPEYRDAQALQTALEDLQRFPPLVAAGEARSLTAELGKVANGKSFLLQGGDCAESFSEYSTKNILNTFRVILQMAVVLTFASKTPVVKIGRVAGQFAKPRSSPVEKQGDVELPSYRGDIINGMEFTPETREPNPQRMIQAYNQAAATLNFLRALTAGGHSNLQAVHSWNLDFMSDSKWSKLFDEMSANISNAMEFMKSCGVDPETAPQLRTANFYTSHEALLLPYEQALTRQDYKTGQYYDTSGHFLWIGDRTRFFNSAHVEFLRGIGNPIGMKCGPSLEPDALLSLLDQLNPDNVAGRITLISRFGSEQVENGLPPLVEAVKKSGHKVVWSCDPMHGNVVKSESGFKTRDFERIKQEISGFFNVHKSLGTYPGGVHLEMTGQDVTECTGGTVADIQDAGLGQRYFTHCDPRLNAAQSLELAFFVADLISKAKEDAAS